jgi:single-stranded-DNA-specific exonuclease
VIRNGRRWRAAPYRYADARALVLELGVDPVLAAVLARRGHADPEAASRFLEASESHDPFEFSGIERAAELVLGHARRGNLIAVHGDYDVDGVCSTALATRALEALGARVVARLPSRLEDGYGVSASAVRELRSQGAELLVTADCGIGAVEQVAVARELGMDVLVTDHHRPGDELPACEIVHPALCGYPCADLCATAVVYKLCQALYRCAGRDVAELEAELDLVALATIADVVPLVGENRALVRKGLRVLAGTGRPGLRALMRVAAIEPQSVREHSVAFGLAPRINAAGRLYRADAGLELMLTADEGRALEIARELDAVNSERRAVETRILFEAEQQLSESSWRDDPLYVLAGEQWHPGVVGIVASRLVERYHRPCVLVGLEDDRGRGSARSIGAYDLHAGLAACSRHLTRFGGHRMAAGLEIERSALEEFRAELVAHAGSHLSAEDLIAVETVDAVVPGDAVALGLAEQLERLRPFGMGNPGVNLLVPASRVGDVRSMGEGRHARFTVRSAGVRTAVVAFGVGGELAAGNEELAGEAGHDLVARLEANEWQGAVEPRLVLRSLHPVTTRDGCVPGEGCAGCTCRATGDDFWHAVWRELERPLEPATAPSATGASRTVVDVRGRGILGSLGDLLSTGEPVAVATLDCSRRRGLIERELDPSRFGRPAGVVLSGRCRPATVAERLAGAPEGTVALVDYATISDDSSLLEGFTHVFALDPPPGRPLYEALAAGSGFLHLGWGPPEVEFAARALEQELELRGPLRVLFSALRQHPGGVAGEELEALLCGEGAHPRPPALAGRCLRVLDELGLIELRRSSATVTCTITSVEPVELERSPAFRACSALHREGMAFLSQQTANERVARAA